MVGIVTVTWMGMVGIVSDMDGDGRDCDSDMDGDGGIVTVTWMGMVGIASDTNGDGRDCDSDMDGDGRDSKRQPFHTSPNISNQNCIGSIWNIVYISCILVFLYNSFHVIYITAAYQLAVRDSKYFQVVGHEQKL